MSTVYWDEGRPFPLVIRIRRDSTHGSEIRRYLPERTFHVIEHERRYSMTQTLVTKMCSACGYEFGSEQHREFPFFAVIDEVEVPRFCQNCGARLEGE